MLGFALILPERISTKPGSSWQKKVAQIRDYYFFA